jgi:hypothetical protein
MSKPGRGNQTSKFSIGNFRSDNITVFVDFDFNDKRLTESEGLVHIDFDGMVLYSGLYGRNVQKQGIVAFHFGQ